MTRVAVEEAREHVAALFGARPREVVFTSSGTEAVNHAIWGGVRRAGLGGDIVTTAVEHSSVLDACRREPGGLTIVAMQCLKPAPAKQVRLRNTGVLCPLSAKIVA